jgi:hypothetical protein
MPILKPKKRSKTSSHKAPKKTIQTEFNRMIAHGKPCSHCGNTYEVTQCSHVHSIGAYPNLRFDPMNVLPMCRRCHKFWWHEEPGDAWEWFKSKYPGRYAYLEVAKNKYVGWDNDKLLEVREKVRNNDIRGLIVAPELLRSS